MGVQFDTVTAPMGPVPHWYPQPLQPVLPPPPTFVPTPIIVNPLTKDDIREVVREELDRERKANERKSR